MPKRKLWLRLQVTDVFKEYPHVYVLERSHTPLTAEGERDVIVSLPYQETREAKMTERVAAPDQPPKQARSRAATRKEPH